MANVVYNEGKYAIARGELGDINGATAIKCMLVTSSYTPNADHAKANITNEVVGTGYTGQRVLARLPAGSAVGLSRSPVTSSQPHFVFDIDADERLPLTPPDDAAPPAPAPRWICGPWSSRRSPCSAAVGSFERTTCCRSRPTRDPSPARA